MADYYIRTPDREESRGPFSPTQLLTLAEAGQITDNTLYYDETKEEWIPIALNEQLKAEVFPQREKLSLKICEVTDGKKSKKKAKKKAIEESDEKEEQGGLDVNVMLAAAEGDTKETRHLKKKKESLEKAAGLAGTSLGIMMMLSAATLLMPHSATISTSFSDDTYTLLVNYPLILIGLFDFLMAACLFLAVTEVFPLIRGRAMLTFGFGIYLGWAVGDPTITIAAGAAGFGILYATIAQSLPKMLFAILLGIGGNGYLVYLATLGLFNDLFNNVMFQLIAD